MYMGLGYAAADRTENGREFTIRLWANFNRGIFF